MNTFTSWVVSPAVVSGRRQVYTTLMSFSPKQLRLIRDHYEDPYHRGRCERATHYGEARYECAEAGDDVIAVELCALDDEIQEAWFDGEGCQLSQAFASMVLEKIEGRKSNEIAGWDLAKLLQLVNLDDVDTGYTCFLLTLTALKNALGSPIDDDSFGPTFSGPDLGDEC